MKAAQYNPRGLESKRPINLRLMPAERAEAVRIAAQAGISQSKLAREAYLRGLPFVEAELSQPPLEVTP